MPIGKNALKRVTGTPAKVEEPKEEETTVAVVKAEPKKKDAPKKATPKKTAPKKSMETEPTFSPVKTAEKVVAKADTTRNGNGYVNIGGELPIYLL